MVFEGKPKGKPLSALSGGSLKIGTPRPRHRQLSPRDSTSSGRDPFGGAIRWMRSPFRKPESLVSDVVPQLKCQHTVCQLHGFWGYPAFDQQMYPFTETGTSDEWLSLTMGLSPNSDRAGLEPVRLHAVQQGCRRRRHPNGFLAEGRYNIGGRDHIYIYNMYVYIYIYMYTSAHTFVQLLI